ncbi:MAG: hypothetical protein ACR2NR_09470 [Solirubrobacteraceae bacterium]
MDDIVEVSVKDGDRGLCGEVVLLGVEFEDQERADRRDVEPGFGDIHIHVQSGVGERLIEAHGRDQFAGIAEDPREDSRRGQI